MRSTNPYNRRASAGTRHVFDGRGDCKNDRETDAKENAAKIKRGAITRSLLDHLTALIYRGRVSVRSLLGEMGAVKNVLAPFVNFNDGSPHPCDEREKQNCLDDHCFDP
jgi:hypothetical protein